VSWTEDWLWPKVTLRRQAQNAIDEGFWAAAFWSGAKAAVTLIEALRSLDESELVGLFLAGLFAALAFGIHRRSRVAAVSALSFFLVARIFLGTPAIPWMVLFLSLLFLNGIRGTFAYHRIPPLAAGLPTVEQSFQAVAKAAPPRETQGEGTKSQSTILRRPV
jgi:hypothetical protein